MSVLQCTPVQIAGNYCAAIESRLQDAMKGIQYAVCFTGNRRSKGGGKMLEETLLDLSWAWGTKR